MRVWSLSAVVVVVVVVSVAHAESARPARATTEKAIQRVLIMVLYVLAYASGRRDLKKQPADCFNAYSKK